MFKILQMWLPLAFIATIMSGLVYGTVQQSLRQDANDPQIQLSEEAVRLIGLGATPQYLTGKDKVEIANSLVPFVVVYSDKGDTLASNVQLNGQEVNVPVGVLQYALAHSQNRVTWQPAPGVRTAIVATAFHGTNNGVVVIGRSLREVEQRESQVLMMAGMAWVTALIGSFILVVFMQQIGTFMMRSSEKRNRKISSKK